MVSGKLRLGKSALLAVLALGAVCLLELSGRLSRTTSGTSLASVAAVETPPGGGTSTIELDEKKLQFVKVEQAAFHNFGIEKTVIGGIDYDQDRQVQVFTPYQGRIIDVLVKVDDVVKVGQALFTIDSPDLLQAESTLIQTAGVLELTSRALARAKKLVPIGGGALKDVDQAISDQQTAEGNHKAAREALRMYGKNNSDADQILRSRQVDSTLVVKSPFDGVVTARNAGPGLFVQPGGAPAPLTVADIKIKWMIGSAAEEDSGALRVGQEITVRAEGVPDRVFRGHLSAIGEAIDASTRRFTVRSDVEDMENVLRPGMFANLVVTTGNSIRAVALPVKGAVREGDGTMTAWVTPDRRHFTQRVVQLGLQKDGFYEVKDGLRAGEGIVSDGALFLDNMLQAAPPD